MQSSARFVSAIRGCVPWFVFDLLSVVVTHCCSVFVVSSHRGWDATVWRCDVRHVRALVGDWNVSQCSSLTFFLEEEGCFSGRLCCRCCHPENRESSTGNVVVTATCATTPLSQAQEIQNKNTFDGPSCTPTNTAALHSASTIRTLNVGSPCSRDPLLLQQTHVCHHQEIG